MSFQFPDLRFTMRSSSQFQRKLRLLVASVMEEKGLTRCEGKSLGMRVHMQVERRKGATKDYAPECLHDAARAFANACKGIVYVESEQLSQLLTTKAYGECNWTLVTIWEVKE